MKILGEYIYMYVQNSKESLLMYLQLHLCIHFLCRNLIIFGNLYKNTVLDLVTRKGYI